MEAFARRGMGVGASQGSSSVRGDETITFVDGKPVITIQPQNVSVCTGNNATFSITATGLNVSYQWQISTDGGANYNNIGGATLSDYTVNGVTIGMNNNRYRCIVSACLPSVTSNGAILTVSNGPTVIAQPNNSTVCEAANTSFTVGGSGGATYQWQLSTDGGVNFNNIAGATTATLNLTAVTASMNNYHYRCVLTSAGCAVPATSNAAILTVQTAPVASSQPQSITLCAGSSNTFSVTATGTNITYQWQVSTDGGANYTNIGGATSASYLLSPLTIGMNNNRYRCIISGTCTPAVTSTAALLTVISPITINTQPTNAQLCSAGNTSFTSTGTGTGIIYQWEVNTGSGFTNVINGGVYSNATTETLTITGAVTAMNGYQYRCKLTNVTCTTPILSNAAVLTVRQLPTVTLSASPLTNLLPGQTTTLTATPSASTGGTLTTNWFLNGTGVVNTGNTRAVNVEQVGDYRVTIQESFTGGLVCSNQSSIVPIIATPSPKFFIFPSPNDGRFTVAYYNDGGANTKRTISIFDSKGSNVYYKLFDIAGAYTLLGIDLRTNNTGIYYVVVGDANGKKLAEGKVHVR
jgi:hypothetical protein